MITISPVIEQFAFKVEMSYPTALNKEEQSIISEMELVALMDAIVKRYDLNRGTEIVTNALQMFMDKYNI